MLTFWLSIWPSGTNFREILIKVKQYSTQKIHFMMCHLLTGVHNAAEYVEHVEVCSWPCVVRRYCGPWAGPLGSVCPCPCAQAWGGPWGPYAPWLPGPCPGRHRSTLQTDPPAGSWRKKKKNINSHTKFCKIFWELFCHFWLTSSSPQRWYRIIETRETWKWTCLGLQSAMCLMLA